MPHYQPTQDRLLVLQDEPLTLFPGTEIEIPERERKHHRPNTGTVAEVGPGRRYDDGQVYPLGVQKGQKVMFAHPDSLTRVDHDGQEHLMMREQDVFLVLGEPKALAGPPTKGRPAQFCVAEAGCSADASFVSVRLNKADVQHTVTPASNQRYSTYNGIEFRTSVHSGLTREQDVKEVAAIPEQPDKLNDLLDALTYHRENRIPVAFIGPPL